MAVLAPIYRERGRAYRADTCTEMERVAKAGEVKVEALARGRYYGRPLAKKALPGICSVGFWDTKQNNQWGLDWQRNEGVELTFLETGSMTYDVDKGSYRLRPGSLTITRPWQLHRVGASPMPVGRLHWLILDVGVRRPNQRWKWPSWLVMTEADRQNLIDVLRHNEQVVWLATAGIRRCFQDIGRAVEADRSGNRISRLAVHISELFVLVLEMFGESHVVLDKSLSSARRTVELFLADLSASVENLAQPWSVRSMAKQCGLGTTHFTQLCREIANLTPAQYLHNCRLEAASRLLTGQSQQSVTQVALACGFSSGQYLASVFRRRYGCSPRAFRGRDAALRHVHEN